MHSLNVPGELSQWRCYDDNTINISLGIIIIIIITQAKNVDPDCLYCDVVLSRRETGPVDTHHELQIILYNDLNHRRGEKQAIVY